MFQRYNTIGNFVMTNLIIYYVGVILIIFNFNNNLS